MHAFIVFRDNGLTLSVQENLVAALVVQEEENARDEAEAKAEALPNWVRPDKREQAKTRSGVELLMGKELENIRSAPNFDTVERIVEDWVREDFHPFLNLDDSYVTAAAAGGKHFFSMVAMSCEGIVQKALHENRAKHSAATLAQDHTAAGRGGPRVAAADNTSSSAHPSLARGVEKLCPTSETPAEKTPLLQATDSAAAAMSEASHAYNFPTLPKCPMRPADLHETTEMVEPRKVVGDGVLDALRLEADKLIISMYGNGCDSRAGMERVLRSLSSSRDALHYKREDGLGALEAMVSRRCKDIATRWPEAMRTATNLIYAVPSTNRGVELTLKLSSTVWALAPSLKSAVTRAMFSIAWMRFAKPEQLCAEMERLLLVQYADELGDTPPWTGGGGAGGDADASLEHEATSERTVMADVHRAASQVLAEWVGCDSFDSPTAARDAFRPHLSRRGALWLDCAPVIRLFSEGMTFHDVAAAQLSAWVVVLASNDPQTAPHSPLSWSWAAADATDMGMAIHHIERQLDERGDAYRDGALAVRNLTATLSSSSDRTMWFHGTSRSSAARIMNAEEVDWNASQPALDLGPGLYVGRSSDVAMQYAVRKQPWDVLVTPHKGVGTGSMTVGVAILFLPQPEHVEAVGDWSTQSQQHWASIVAAGLGGPHSIVDFFGDGMLAARDRLPVALAHLLHDQVQKLRIWLHDKLDELPWLLMRRSMPPFLQPEWREMTDRERRGFNEACLAVRSEDGDECAAFARLLLTAGTAQWQAHCKWAEKEYLGAQRPWQAATDRAAEHERSLEAAFAAFLEESAKHGQSDRCAESPAAVLRGIRQNVNSLRRAHKDTTSLDTYLAVAIKWEDAQKLCKNAKALQKVAAERELAVRRRTGVLSATSPSMGSCEALVHQETRFFLGPEVFSSAKTWLHHVVPSTVDAVEKWPTLEEAPKLAEQQARHEENVKRTPGAQSDADAFVAGLPDVLRKAEGMRRTLHATHKYADGMPALRLARQQEQLGARRHVARHANGVLGRIRGDLAPWRTGATVCFVDLRFDAGFEIVEGKVCINGQTAMQCIPAWS